MGHFAKQQFFQNYCPAKYTKYIEDVYKGEDSLDLWNLMVR